MYAIDVAYYKHPSHSLLLPQSRTSSDSDERWCNDLMYVNNNLNSGGTNEIGSERALARGVPGPLLVDR